MATAKQDLQEQVDCLRDDLEKAGSSKVELQSFLQEALLANDKGIDTRVLFFSLIKNTQELHLDLLRNEELLSQQKEELRSMKEIRKKVAEYQRRNQIDQIPQFSAMKLKSIQIDLSAGEDLNAEACGVISNAKKECRRIWNSANAMIEEAGLPRIGRWEMTLTESSWLETMREAQ